MLGATPAVFEGAVPAGAASDPTLSLAPVLSGGDLSQIAGSFLAVNVYPLPTSMEGRQVDGSAPR